MIDSCCEISENFIEFLENLHGDEECVDDEIMEAHYDFSSQQESVASSLDETDSDQKREMPIPNLENENHRAGVNCYKTQVSPLSKDEIDQLLKCHVTAQDNEAL